jgi:hypothetical protein
MAEGDGAAVRVDAILVEPQPIPMIFGSTPTDA